MNDPWAFGWTQLLAIAGLLLTVTIAIAGFRTFGRWKREQIEERRIDVAIDALALAYEAILVFDSMRARGVNEGEFADMEPAPRGNIVLEARRRAQGDLMRF
jgi:hypothetical protein